MALPTTAMPGYTDLQGRIVDALGRCQERPWLDFKESQPWPVLKWRLLKTMMAMANLRDGGLIIVGVAERGANWDLAGVRSDDLDSYGPDEIQGQLEKFASPQVEVDIVLHDHSDGKRYLAFHVRQFKETPVVCKRNCPDELTPRNKLASGDIYVRPSSGVPRTEKVTDAALLHDLLELAAELRARRMLEVGSRIGLVPGDSSSLAYDAEIASMIHPPVPPRGERA